MSMLLKNPCASLAGRPLTHRSRSPFFLRRKERQAENYTGFIPVVFPSFCGISGYSQETLPFLCLVFPAVMRYNESKKFQEDLLMQTVIIAGTTKRGRHPKKALPIISDSLCPTNKPYSWKGSSSVILRKTFPQSNGWEWTGGIANENSRDLCEIFQRRAVGTVH